MHCNILAILCILFFPFLGYKQKKNKENTQKKQLLILKKTCFLHPCFIDNDLTIVIFARWRSLEEVFDRWHSQKEVFARGRSLIRNIR